jgi:predicted ArsR family transcriptional regulator
LFHLLLLLFCLYLYFVCVYMFCPNKKVGESKPAVCESLLRIQSRVLFCWRLVCIHMLSKGSEKCTKPISSN